MQAVRDAGLRFLNEGDELQFEIEDGLKDLRLLNFRRNLNFLKINNCNRDEWITVSLYN